MYRLGVALAFMALFCARETLAASPSFHIPHPVGWMHLLPVGEQPGWTSPNWFSFELSQANIWNSEFTMTDRRNGNVYTYKADYEQTTAVMDIGFALNDSWAFSLEVPYANHNGGFLDDFIDQFHVFIKTVRFLRPQHDNFGNSFVIRTNGEDRLTSEHAEGVGNLKAKLKWWFYQLPSAGAGACECGMAFSVQGKIPTQKRQHGLSSGTSDFSALTHVGMPIGSYGGIYATAALTKLGKNDTFAGWPRRQWAHMYELSLDIGIDSVVGIIAQARMESPLFMREHLLFNYTYNNEYDKANELEASGWNSLVEWRAMETLGLRWRYPSGSSFSLMIIEDWTLGDRSSIRKDWNYVTNAPDVGFITQWHFVF